MLALEANTRITAHDIDNDPEMFVEPGAKQTFKVRYGMGQNLIHNLYTSKGYFLKLNILKSEIGIVGDIVEITSIRDGRINLS